MQQRRFGKTDLLVSEVGFGCARIGGVFEGASRADLLRTLRMAYDAGITFFDTADMYTQGESERLIGGAFARDRAKVVIASKAGYCLPAQKKAIARIKPLLRPVVRRVGLSRSSIPSSLKGIPTQNFTAEYLISAVEASLRRLGTDYLDLFQLHSPPRHVLEAGDFLDPLEKLKRDGKIRYYGVSCETTDDAVICLRYPNVSALQVRVSLLEQSVLTRVLPEAKAARVGIIARECFAGGMLAKGGETLPPELATDELEVYRRLAADFGRSLPETAIQFVLDVEGVSVTLLGMRTQRHVAANLDMVAAPRLTLEEQQALRSTSVLARSR